MIAGWSCIFASASLFVYLHSFVPFSLASLLVFVTMAVQGVLQALTEPLNQISIATVVLILLLVTYFTLSFTELETAGKLFKAVTTYAKFAYSCFLKPHTGDNTGNQQDALESFYKTQAGIYDVTRSRLLRGREDMLAMAAAQLRHQLEQGQYTRKPIWVVSYISSHTRPVFGHCANSTFT
jgi:predicted PurR-regulated permease PerM